MTSGILHFGTPLHFLMYAPTLMLHHETDSILLNVLTFIQCNAKPLDNIITSHIVLHDTLEEENVGGGPLHIQYIHKIKLNHA